MQVLDLRNLIKMINDKKDIGAELSLEFDCTLDVEDPKPLVKVINYAINFVNDLTDQKVQIALNASMSGMTLTFTAFTKLDAFPELNSQVADVLKDYEGKIELSGDPSKYVQLLIFFNH